MKKIFYTVIGLFAMNTMVAQNSVFDVISGSPNHTVLTAALTQEGLDVVLDDLSSNYTVFAPDDAAFTQFLSDAGITSTDLLNDPDLSKVLLHHVVSGTVLSTSLSNGEVTTLSDLDVTVDITMGVMIDSANVTGANLPADNGTVHVVDYVLLPTYDDVTEVVATSADHTTLLLALQTAGLVGTLQDQSSAFTVFAPTDAAFTQFLTDAGITATDLLNDPDLSKVLLHHVVAGTVLSTDLANGEVTTLSELDVTVDLSMAVMIDDAEVTLADIIADNGAVHVIDYVLLPTYDDVTEIVATSPDHTTLLLALQTAGLVGTLQDQSAEYTVFAPTDAAFTQFLSDAGLTATDLLNASNLSEILLHHVVSGTVMSTDLANGNVTTLNGTDVTVDLSMGVMIDDAEVTLADIIADNGVVHVLDGVLSLPAATLIDEESISLSAFPNPFNEFIQLNLADNTPVQVLSVTGKIVATKMVQGGVIQMSELPKGVYFLQVENGSAVKVIKA
jgi:transforming growth factor-beta-induced protein